MNRFLTLALMLFAALKLSAQTTQSIATGAGYQKQSFVRLSAGTEKQVANTAWDIAFSVFGDNKVAGVFFNESAGSSMGNPLPEVILYDALTDNFEDQPDPSFLEIFRLYNVEKSWDFGAFNEVRDTTNPLDYGWGLYNSQTDAITGNRVYVVQLRNSQYRKIIIESLAGGVYTFKYANLDGSNTVTKTVNKADYPGRTLAYFSLDTGNFVDAEPAGGGFDLVYWRYITDLYEPGSMTYIPYAVTGILHGLGAQAAEADGVNPATVQFSNYQDSLSSDIHTIGHDWKSFSGTSWSLDPDRVFFLKTADSHVWKIRFMTFEGSTTGKTTFQKTDLGLFSAVDDPAVAGMEALIYPNPVQDVLTVSIDKVPASAASSARLELVGADGRIAASKTVTLVRDFQVFTLPVENIGKGLYFLRAVWADRQVSLGNVVKE